MKKMQIAFQHLLWQFTIKNRLLFLNIVFTFLVTIWSVYMIKSNIDDTVNEAVSINSRIIQVVTDEINNAFSVLNTVTKFPVVQNPAPLYLYDYLSGNADDISSKLKYYYDVDDNISKMMALYPSLYLTALYDNSGNGVLRMRSTTSTVLNTDLSAFDRGEDIILAKGSPVLIPSDSFGQIQIHPPDNTISAARAVMRALHFAQIGMIVSSVDISSSIRYFQNSRLYEEQALSLYSAEGQILLGTQELDGYALALKDSQKKVKKSEPDMVFQSTFTEKSNGQYYLYNYSIFPTGELCLLSTPYKQIIYDTLRKQMLLTLFSIITLVIVLLLTNQIIISITRPLRKLSNAIPRLGDGDFTPLDITTSKDEIKQITGAYNEMLRKIQTLVYEVYEKNTIQAQTELQMLRAQITPHYVYNTLETIRARAEIAGQSELSRMVYILSQNLRYGISEKDPIVTVEQEIQCVSSYLELQQLHNRQKLTWKIIVDPEIMGYPVIKMLLQPLVENAIYHGIQSIEGEGKIEIFGTREGEELIFQVSDNGAGIEPERVKMLNEYINGGNDQFTSIGIKNVNRRIHLYHGTNYGLEIRSVLGHGTLITVRIPYCK